MWGKKLRRILCAKQKSDRIYKIDGICYNTINKAEHTFRAARSKRTKNKFTTMSTIQKYLEVLNQTHEIALATSVNARPNVRIVNVCCKAEQPNILYFSSDRTNQKVVEFGENSNVAFTSIPHEGIEHIRSNNAVVRKSQYTINEVKELFLANIPGYDETLNAIGETLDVFEIHIKEAVIVTGFEEPVILRF
ncbi:hypothetical protein FACS18942_06410 [Planctomycetales bacterium]|nr:hypothetical protein FACS18942_06410 [Planctomycetales bacterium]